MRYFVLAQGSIPESLIQNNSLFKNLKKNQNSLIHQYSIQKFKNCGVFFASFARMLGSNYWLAIIWLSLYEYHWQRWKSNFLSMLPLWLKPGFCKFSLTFAKLWKYVQGPRNESGPIRVWAQMSWDVGTQMCHKCWPETGPNHMAWPMDLKTMLRV